jgi:metabotropic X receptor
MPSKAASSTSSLLFCLISVVLQAAAEHDEFNFVTNIPKLRHSRGIRQRNHNFTFPWPVKRVATITGDLTLGALMMVHEREDLIICGPIMPQGGIQALETMLFTIDHINSIKNFIPGVRMGAYILDDCDKDTYGLEQAVDFVKGKTV